MTETSNFTMENKIITNNDNVVKINENQSNNKKPVIVKRVKGSGIKVRVNSTTLSKELEHMLGFLSDTSKDTRLTQTEIMALKSFVTAIKGLSKSGNVSSAYVVAKNAVTYLSRASYPFDHLNYARNQQAVINNSPAVELNFSDKVKNPAQKVEINDRDAISKYLKLGEFLNKKI